MTKRPTFIGVTTLVALTLTAGLAFGAGRLVGTQTRSAHPARQQQVATTGAVPAAYSNVQGQARQGSTHGATFRTQMRQWMQDWMRNHGWNGQSWAARGPQGASQNAGTYQGGYANGGTGCCSGRHYAGSGNWSGNAGAGYGYGDHYGYGAHYGERWDDDCW